MLKISFNLNSTNYVIINDNHFFIYFHFNRPYLIDAKCKHRHGPLFMGEVCKEQKYIICPWHFHKTSIASLIQNGKPLIKVGHKIHIYLNLPESTQYFLQYYSTAILMNPDTSTQQKLRII